MSTCHLDGVQIRNELTFWRALRVTLDKVGKLLCQEQEKGSSISEVYQEFFRLGKMVGTEIRKYRTRLSQCTLIIPQESSVEQSHMLTSFS